MEPEPLPGIKVRVAVRGRPQQPLSQLLNFILISPRDLEAVRHELEILRGEKQSGKNQVTRIEVLEKRFDNLERRVIILENLVGKILGI